MADGKWPEGGNPSAPAVEHLLLDAMPRPADAPRLFHRPLPEGLALTVVTDRHGRQLPWVLPQGFVVLAFAGEGTFGAVVCVRAWRYAASCCFFPYPFWRRRGMAGERRGRPACFAG